MTYIALHVTCMYYVCMHVLRTSLILFLNFATIYYSNGMQYVNYTLARVGHFCSMF